MNIGNKVVWKSAARGTWKTKEGFIIDIVKPGQEPDKKYWPHLFGKYSATTRAHESYIVKVGNRHYWPIVSKLEKVY